MPAALALRAQETDSPGPRHPASTKIEPHTADESLPLTTRHRAPTPSLRYNPQA